MTTRKLKIKVSGEIGSVSAEVTEAGQMTAIMTLAHGAGAGMHHPFMVSLATELASLGIGTLRFNFPYMENKKGRPDTPAVAHQSVAAAIASATDLFPTLPLFPAGKSFGGRMTSQFLSKGSPVAVKGAVFFGFPLHAPGKPSMDRAEHLPQVKVPMLFLQGSRDEFAEWKLIESVCARLDASTLTRFEGANHSFKVAKRNILPELAAAAQSWIANIIG